MCPSYMVTREEKHNTRGRAHLLFEMMNGEVLTGGWRDEAVKDALDLCLSCKWCKHDCPVNVDMATYKAEFLAHYYERRTRPRHAYSMGLIDVWSRLASLASGLANFFGQTPGFSAIAKFLGGIAPERTLPPFAAETFRSWFFRRRPQKRTVRRLSCGPIPSPITSGRSTGRQPSQCSKTPVSGSTYRARISVAAGRFTISACSISRNDTSATSS
jgi:Fe-S oxidoreductase